MLNSEWQKASASDNSGGNCLEVKTVGNAVAIRDTEDETGAILTVRRDVYDAFCEGIRSGELV